MIGTAELPKHKNRPRPEEDDMTIFIETDLEGISGVSSLDMVASGIGTHGKG